MENLELEKQRNDLNVTDQEILVLFGLRKMLVENIQNYKKEKGLPAWDPKRELEIFKKIIDENPSLTFLASYSLLLESHIAPEMGYPKWSESEHLAEKTGTIIDVINPILLFVVNKSEYSKLKLKPNFQEKINEII